MFRTWYQTKTREAAKSCWFGAIALIPVCLIAATITWWAIFIGMLIGPGHLLDLSWTGCSISAWVILAVACVWQFTRGRNHKEEYKFSGRAFSNTEWAAIRLSGETWLTFVFDPSAGRAFVTFLAAWFITAPKLAGLSLILHARAKRLNADTIEAYMPVLCELMQAKSAIPLNELAERHKIADPIDMLRTLTAIDGVVALTQDDLSLTIAPRLTQEFQDWLRDNS